MFGVERTFGNYNPAGIDINPGWYALAVAIICDVAIDEACAYIREGKIFNRCKKQNERQSACKRNPGKKTLRVLAAHEKWPEMSSRKLAETLGISRTTICKVLHANRKGGEKK